MTGCKLISKLQNYKTVGGKGIIVALVLMLVQPRLQQCE